jgi:hypothetical protein
MESQREATITVRVQQAAVKIHGENSPDVLSGKVSVGHREEVASGEKLREINYETAVELFGIEDADELFRGVKEEQDGEAP